ncbi:hypothetical protein QFC22_000333 [Naganishia vaughanmartiniae]|uniref:Uncharacterized protein n=1 Tax=Naganishia vaughanmartiniae TaxID=1424756 RepID=A0ACC2XP18_9TREE|nr:hypothetical protein QFC22_000333 [Naganishia vaughanmartiniae]
MVVSNIFIKSTEILAPERILHFPASPAFRHLPADLVPFAEFQGKGIYVPLALTANDVDRGEDNHPSNLEEIDGQGIPTIHLRTDSNDPYAPRPFHTRLGVIVRVPVEDAWKLGRDEGWVEPHGTSRCLRHDASRLPHLPTGTHIRKSEQTDGEWIMPSEEEEVSAFVRDMEGAMKRYWVKVMGEAHARSHLITAKESFEIVNTFLHYLLHHRIFTPEEPYFLSSLTNCIALSTRMLEQIKIAQLLCNVLPGTNEPRSWHAFALQAWLRIPAIRSDEEWTVNGELMRLRIEAEFTEAREESLARNLEEQRECAGRVPGEEEQVNVVEQEVEEKSGVGEDGYTRGVKWTDEDVAVHAADEDMGETDVVDVNVDSDGWHVEGYAALMETLTKAIGSPVTEFSITAKREPAMYTITHLSHDRPESVVTRAGQRLDVKFIEYARGVRAGSSSTTDGDVAGHEFLWLTLTPQLSGESSKSKGDAAAEEEVVVLVDAYGKGGSSPVQQMMDKEQARGMGIKVGLICIGRSGQDQREGTWLVDTLDEVVPRF